MEEKDLQLERLVFFCDAVVAIAITLLVFNLKMDHDTSKHLTFKDLLQPWKIFLAFFLSFINIASFWKAHHTFFAHIKKIDERLLTYNVAWLFFIVTLPFSTSLVSNYFFDPAAIFLYSLNIFFITIAQNQIWDYASLKTHFIRHETIEKSDIYRLRVYCNLDMINSILALALSFFFPVIAFICLFTKLPLYLIARIYLNKERRMKRGISKIQIKRKI